MEDIILKYKDKEIKVLIHYFHNQIFYEKTKQKGTFGFSEQFLKIKWENSNLEEIFIKSDNKLSDILIYENINYSSIDTIKNTSSNISINTLNNKSIVEPIISKLESLDYKKIDIVDNSIDNSKKNILPQISENKSNEIIKLIHPSWKDECFKKEINTTLFVERIGVVDEKGKMNNIFNSNIYKIEWEKWDEEYFIQWNNSNDYYHSSFINCIKIEGTYYLINNNLEQIYFKNKIIPCGITKKECFLNQTQYTLESIDVYMEFIKKIEETIEYSLEPIYLLNNKITNKPTFVNLNVKYSSEKYLLNSLEQWKNCLFIIYIETLESINKLEYILPIINSETIIYLYIVETLYNKIKLILQNYTENNVIIQPIKSLKKNIFENNYFFNKVLKTLKIKKNEIFNESIVKSIMYINLENFNNACINSLLTTNYPKYWDCFFFTKNKTFIKPFKILVEIKKIINSIECLSDLIMFFILVIIFNKIKIYQLKNLKNNFIIWFKIKNIEYFQSKDDSDFQGMNLKTILI